MDYKKTIFLPETDFPLRSNHKQKEQELLVFWDSINLSQLQKNHRDKCPSFVLHDGPPYANGFMHLGHATNRIFKDAVARSEYMRGKAINYRPGWDCHGLPIESKVEEQYKKQGISKHEVDVTKFRQSCREFADHWLNIQKEQCLRLGLIGDWSNPYKTMDFAFEGKIVQGLLCIVRAGDIVRDIKPIMWSVSEETALAEAEIEYREIVSESIYVKFPIMGNDSRIGNTCGTGSISDDSNNSASSSSSIVIWTTTPWTIPGNRAIAYGAEIDYAKILVKRSSDTSLVAKNEVLWIASELLDQFTHDVGIEAYETIAIKRGCDLAGMVCRHPLHGHGYDFSVPLIAAEHVTTETGTGFVHTAPEHGPEDFNIARRYDIEIPALVQGNGRFAPGTPLFADRSIWSVNKEMPQILRSNSMLLHSKQYNHSYPHSWRSKAPLIYRTTPQWFIRMDGPSKLRQLALQAIEQVNWIPKESKNRITKMVASRPDWCISRQRSWGVPLCLLVNKHTHDILIDDTVFQDIVEKVTKNGADFWFQTSTSDILSLHPSYNAEEYEKVNDIIDVWFESGVTHNFVLSREQFPADLYLEGSDQHRGWFQSSLLVSCALHKVAPYKSVLTHGFIVDENGRKMSKSSGNGTAPSELIDKYGADMLHLWVLNNNVYEDLKFGDAIIKKTEENYRKIRNTIRYLLGALANFRHEELVVEYSSMPQLEQWVYARLYSLQVEHDLYMQTYDFRGWLNRLYMFCAQDLSAFYFNIRKDSLYCDHINSSKRRSNRTTYIAILHCLLRWLAPILPFMTEEAWQSLKLQPEVLRQFVGKNDMGGFANMKGNCNSIKDISNGVKDSCSSLKDACNDMKDTYNGMNNGDAIGDVDPMVNNNRHHDSVHLQSILQLPHNWQNTALEDRYYKIRTFMLSVTGALENAREKKLIRSSLEAHPHITAHPVYRDLLADIDLAEMCITSQCTIKYDVNVAVNADGNGNIASNAAVNVSDENNSDGHDSIDEQQIAVVIELASGQKCNRCWRITTDVTDTEQHICSRCRCATC